jgi:hypothetical protein
MAMSLILYDGETPDRTRPVIATNDPSIVEAVCEILRSRLIDRPPTPVVELCPPGTKAARGRRRLEPVEGLAI